MAKLSPTSFQQSLLVTTSNSGSVNPHCCAQLSPVLGLPNSDEQTEGQVFQQTAAGVCCNQSSRQLSLIERREKCSTNNLLSLNAETLQEKSRDGSAQDVNARSLFSGWLATQFSETLPLLLPNAMVKIISYNILAQRLVSTDRYPHCPMFALAENYRCSLLKQQLSEAAPDIIALQEVSVDVFKGPKLLGAWLRSEKRYAGNHVVITDTEGRPMCEEDDVSPNTSSSNGCKKTTSFVLNSQQCNNTHSGVAFNHNEGSKLRTRPEMEGVCIFYLKDRFVHCETVPIRFNEIAASDNCLTQREERLIRVRSHNVALISVLRDRQAPGITYVVATVHLTWQHTECQLWQVHHVLQKMEQLKLKYERSAGGTKKCPRQVCLVLAGDFNSDAGAPPMRYAVTGVPPPGSHVMKCWQLPEAEAEEEGAAAHVPHGGADKFAERRRETALHKRYRITDTIRHSLNFSDSYAAYRKLHPLHVSAVTPSLNGEGGVLDHVLVDEQHVVCTSLVRLSIPAELPTTHCPSDHYPVGATIVPRTTSPV